MAFTWTDIVSGARADPEPINNLGNHVAAYTGLRRARQVILTAAVSAISFSTDDDGNALNSTMGGELRVYIPANASVATMASYYFQLNGLTSGYWYSSAQSYPYAMILTCGSHLSMLKMSVDIVGGYVFVSGSYNYQYSTGSGTGGALSCGGVNAAQTAITALKLYFFGYTFPIGTVVEWWERG